MANVSSVVVEQLSQRLQIDPDFFVQCIQESVIEVQEIEGRWDLSNGTILRLRQLERICVTLDIGVPGALHILKLTQRVNELEEQIQLLTRDL